MVFPKEACLLFASTWILLLTNVSCGVNLGLISGDLKRSSSPLVIKKISRHSPITINIHSAKSPKKLSSPLNSPKVSLSKLLPTRSKLKSLSKLKPAKSKLNKLLPPKIHKSKLAKLLSPKISKLPRIKKLPKVPIIPPIIPRIPLLPLPLLPIIPPLPLLPLPIVPPVLKPLKVPILKTKLALQKALGTELRPVIKPPSVTRNKVLKKLLDLKTKGSLTTAEFLRFKNLLL